MPTESSALIALSHLQDLEAERVHREQRSRQAVIEAERQARELAQQRAREQAERLAAEQAARLHAEHQAQAQREHEDHLRVQEAEARARVAHDARLRQEQLRLAAQIRMSEQRARPRWPLAVVPVLLLGVAGASVLAWQGRQHEAEAKLEAQETVARNADVLAEVTAKLDALEAEQSRMQQVRADLEAELAAAKGNAGAETALREQLAALDADIATNDRARAQANGGRARPRPHGTRPKPDAKPDKPPRTRPVLELSNTNDPLAGIK
jgi:hypothetical protein